MNSLYLFWQEQGSRRWYPVGRLTRSDDQSFEFVYTAGAEMARGFVPFGRMTDVHKSYRSTELFPLFANRVLSRSRPEYEDYIRWIGADSRPNDPMLILARTGGQRATDSLMVYAKPEPNEACEFDLIFLCHGVRHLPEEAIDRINQLRKGEALYPMLDIINPFDADAVGLRTGDPAWFVGYVPRFFARDVKTCMQSTDPTGVHLRVVRVNPDAPLQLRLLCRLTTPWPRGFESCSGPEYDPLVRTAADARCLYDVRTGQRSIEHPS